MSLPLLPAVLLRLREGPAKKGEPPQVVVDDKARNKGVYPVQFNPTSLKLSRTNNVDKGGATVRAQARQNPSARSATLSFDLEYDTAEGDDDGRPLDVQKRIEDVRQFVEPPQATADAGRPPPRVRFVWGTFTFTGIVSQLTEDLDYFAPDGRPLRAKLSVTITEQNLRFEGTFAGPGARGRTGATPPGGAAAAAGPNARPTSNPDQAVAAQDGESVQQLLTRLGLDPAAWRTAMAGLAGPLTLAAGAQVQLRADAAVAVGLGATAGFAAGAQVGGTASLAAALGVGASAGAGVPAGFSAGASAGAGLQVGGGARASASAAAGFALAEGGGIRTSMNLVVAGAAVAAAADARAAFGVPGGVNSGVSGGVSASASAGVSAGASASVVGTAARRAVVVDPRTQSYGRSIPLRARPALPL